MSALRALADLETGRMGCSETHQEDDAREVHFGGRRPQENNAEFRDIDMDDTDTAISSKFLRCKWCLFTRKRDLSMDHALAKIVTRARSMDQPLSPRSSGNF